MVKANSLDIGALFSVNENTDIKINSNGSGVYKSVAKPDDVYKIVKITKNSVICSSINLKHRGFSDKFKGFYIPANTIVSRKNNTINMITDFYNYILHDDQIVKSSKEDLVRKINEFKTWLNQVNAANQNN